jgi:cytochrome o ubiquinol oxidase subunit IV
MNSEPDYKHELRSYLIGFGLALTLTLAAFAVVVIGGGLEPMHRIALIAIFGLVQLVVHFGFFLHIDFSKQKREDLHLILFSVLLLIIMVGGTIWIITNLAMRMR